MLLALAACGQKGPLYLPEQAGPAAKSPDKLPSAPLPPVEGASSPGLPAAVK